MKKLRRRPTRFAGLTVGLDLHQKFTQFSVLDEAGDEIANDRIASKPEVLTGLIDRLRKKHDRVQVCLEACGCFLWAYDLLAEQLSADRVHVAAPSKVRAIAESNEKNDENDAWWLAYLLFEGRLPEAFVATGDLRELRIATRELRSIIDQRSDLKRQLKSHLRQLGLSLGKNAWSSIAARKRSEELIQRIAPEHGIRGQAILRIHQRLKDLDQEVDHWREQVDQLAKRFDQVQSLDDQLPGVGPTIAAIVWAELGDPKRYRSAKAYAKATGLTPGDRESGGKRSHKKITREGSAHVRWALTRAIVSCTRAKKGAGLAIKRWLEKAYRRKPKKAAIVAAARKLAEGVWRLFALGEAFDLSRAFGGRPAIAGLKR